MSSKPNSKQLKQACYLVDASSFIFRAYYGLNTNLMAPDGTPTHATFGFCQMMLNLLDKCEPDTEVLLLWDRKEKGFRHDIYPEYKANRGAPPEDLGIQIENSKRFIEYMGLKQLSVKGYEADDLIASVVDQDTLDKPCYIVATGDKDLLQLINDKVYLLDTMKNKWLHEAEALAKFGVTPDKIIDVQALSGDSVDNIPGIPGVGGKTAAALIQEFDSFNAVLEEAQIRAKNTDKKVKYKDALKGKKIINIAENLDKAEISLKLVTLKRDIDLSPYELNRSTWKPEELSQYCKELGFNKLMTRFQLADQDSAPEKKASPSKKLKFKSQNILNDKQLSEVLEEHHESSYLALDTETFGLDDQEKNNVVGISLAFNEEEAFYIPLRHQGYNWPEGEAGIEKTQLLLRAFIDDTFKGALVMQNAKFDLNVLANDYFGSLEMGVDLFDTMIASFLLYPDQKKGLDFMADKYLNHKMIGFLETLDSAKDFSFVSLDQAQHYAAEDAWATLRLALIFEEELNVAGFTEYFKELEMPLCLLLSKMECLGMSLCEETLESLRSEFDKDLKNLEKDARALLENDGIENFEDVNLQSPKQMAKLLFEDLNLPIIKKTKSGPSTNISVLNKLVDQHPIVELLIESRELNKLNSTYVLALSELRRIDTKKIHTHLSQSLTATGRLSSSNPNLQNIPIKTKRGMKIRSAFVAPEDRQLISLDYSQVELRILAELSDSKVMKQYFHDGVDIHTKTAADMFDVDFEEVNSEQRRMAKAINFGIIYGQTAYGLAKAQNISNKEAQGFIDTYYDNFDGIRDYMDDCKEQAKDKGFVQTIGKRKRYLKDINSKNRVLREMAERMAVNTSIQGSAADIMKAAMIQVHRKLPKTTQILLQVHDEIIVECPSDKSQEIALLCQDIMEHKDLLKKIDVEPFEVHMKTEFSIGSNWAEAK